MNIATFMTTAVISSEEIPNIAGAEVIPAKNGEKAIWFKEDGKVKIMNVEEFIEKYGGDTEVKPHEFFDGKAWYNTGWPRITWTPLITFCWVLGVPISSKFCTF